MQNTISVLMPTYNDEIYLAEAIESVLNQTYPYFEFILFDDGSTDSTRSILDRYRSRDKRIKVVTSSFNHGRGEARNHLLRIGKTAGLIAIMDSDDIAMPDRFEKQIRFLNENPDISILGTQVLNIDNNRRPTQYQTKLPLTHGLLAWSLLYSVPFCNPSVMLRSNIIDKVGEYKSDSAVEDADYWSRAVFHGRFANLPDILLQYRMPEARLMRRMQDWDIPLRQVNSEFIEHLTGISVDINVINIIRLSMYQSLESKIPENGQSEIILLLHKILHTMVQKKMLLNDDTYEIMSPMLYQLQSLTS
jgi:glycosyltransferase involved in cell wall biosynthesis